MSIESGIVCPFTIKPKDKVEEKEIVDHCQKHWKQIYERNV